MIPRRKGNRHCRSLAGSARLVRTAAGTLLALAVALQASVAARAEDVAEFFKGRTLQIIVGYGPGGGNDVYARVLARHLGKHLPGGPNSVVQNMPGAGSLLAANNIATIAPKDGSTFGTFARNLPLVAVLGANPNVRFDARKLTWLGSASSYQDDAYILWVRRDASMASIGDARKQNGPELVLAGTAPGDTSYDVPVLLKQALGLNIRLVGGYRDAAGMFLAVENKEVDGRVADLSSVRSSRAHWIGSMAAFLQFGRATRHPDFAGVPTARELARTDADRRLIEIMEVPFALTRPYAGPPEIPADRAKALQQAFMAVQKDPEYLEEAKKLQLDISPIGPEAVLKLLDDIAAAPPELLARVKSLVAAN